jgi:hypothetical protein
MKFLRKYRLFKPLFLKCSFPGEKDAVLQEFYFTHLFNGSKPAHLQACAAIAMRRLFPRVRQAQMICKNASKTTLSVELEAFLLASEHCPVIYRFRFTRHIDRDN